MVCCTSSWETAWSPWTIWRRWTVSGEIGGLRKQNMLNVNASAMLTVQFPVFWKRFHRLRPEGGHGHGLLHVPVFHPAKQPLLQQHQPATWDLCPWFTWSRQVSEASKWTLNESKRVQRSAKHPGSHSAERCRCAVDRLRAENGSFLILCTDASGKNSTAGRILEIAKGKDYGELKFPWHLPWPPWFTSVSFGLFEYFAALIERLTDRETSETIGWSCVQWYRLWSEK